MQFSLITFLSFFFFAMHLSGADTPNMSSNANREKLLGNILKQTLENYHYRKMKINDDVSLKAFNEFLKGLDYGKQFLTAGDVESLRKFELRMDDDMVSGNHVFLEEAIGIFTKRVKQAESYRAEIFKKQFNFTKDESLELDPDKRQWAKKTITPQREMEENL